jgi:transcriptional regulator with XRE-family HTH domain
MARAALDWSSQDLARAAQVGVNTVNRFEAGQDARVSSVDKMRGALQAAGLVFLEENGEGIGVRFSKPAVITDHPKPVGPATDLIERMDAAIEAHQRIKLKRSR